MESRKHHREGSYFRERGVGLPGSTLYFFPPKSQTFLREIIYLLEFPGQFLQVQPIAAHPTWNKGECHQEHAPNTGNLNGDPIQRYQRCLCVTKERMSLEFNCWVLILQNIVLCLEMGQVFPNYKTWIQKVERQCVLFKKYKLWLVTFYNKL